MVLSRTAMSVEVRDVASGLWLWRQRHPSWREGADWPAVVASFAVRSREATLLLDPLAPPPAAREVWDRIEVLAPETVVVLKPDHVRDVDLFVRWYGTAAYGPQLFWRDDVPKTELRVLHPGDKFPGGLVAYHDGRGVLETPLYFPSSARWCSPTRSPPRRASCASGRRLGMRSGRYPRFARSWNSTSSTSSSLTVSRCTAATTSWRRASASLGRPGTAPDAHDGLPSPLRREAALLVG
jgi:hypothetical protein